MRRLLRLTGLHRTPQSDAGLGALLAFNAGAINAGGFLVVHAYTSHMTGFVSTVADSVVVGRADLALGGLGVLLAFTAGAMVTALLINWSRRRRLHSVYALPLLLESLLLLVFGMAGGLLHGAGGSGSVPAAAPLTVALLAFLMGLQNALITKLSSAQVRTTHMTGVITDLGIELGKLLYWNRPGAGGPPDVHADPLKLRLFGTLLGMFLLGGVVGAAGFQSVGFVTVLPLAVVLLALCLPPIASDLRAARTV